LGQLSHQCASRQNQLPRPDKDVFDLIEHPVSDFPLRYESAASCHILKLTRGHPHLVQLLCYEIVELKNRQSPLQRLLVTIDDVDTAIPNALQTGDFFFADIANQVGATGLAVLKLIAENGQNSLMYRSILEQQQFDSLDETLALLV
jgi:hypothetical protein